MNIIEIQNVNDLQNILHTDILITQNVTMLEEELNYNMWCMYLAKNSEITLHNLLDFFETLFKQRSQQIAQSSITSPITFYMWFDEMALQLRFNFISGCSQELPFSGSIELVDKPDKIINNFLKTRKWPDPLPEEIEEQENETEFTFSVYKKCLVPENRE